MNDEQHSCKIVRVRFIGFRERFVYTRMFSLLVGGGLAKLDGGGIMRA
jgi:hypothetical protein